MRKMINVAQTLVRGTGVSFSDGIADCLGGQRFFDAVYGSDPYLQSVLGINHWGDRSTWNDNFRKLKGYVEAHVGLVAMKGMFWSMADNARFEDLWTAMVENIMSSPNMRPHSDIFIKAHHGYFKSTNFDAFMGAYYTFLEDFLGMWVTGKVPLYLSNSGVRVDRISRAILRDMETRVFGTGDIEKLVRWWGPSVRELIPRMQFEYLRLASMFNVAGSVHRIGDWHVAKIRHELVHPDIGPIEYYIAFKAGASADLFTSGIRVFTTWGTLEDKDDSSTTYPGWARPTDKQVAALDDMLSNPIYTPEEHINLLNDILTPGATDYIPWTPFISHDADRQGHATQSFGDLIPDI